VEPHDRQVQLAAGFEGALDSVHLNWLHSGWRKSDKPEGHNPLSTVSPSYEIEETIYGLRTAAIRKIDPATQHFRVAEFIAPFYAFSASRQPVIPSDCSVFISVPIDDENHILLFGFWDEVGPLADVTAFFPSHLNLDNLFAGQVTTPETAWGQDRAAMAAGHFSGFTSSVLHEDLGVQMSMGPIVDRSAEQLCGTDLAIVRMRRYLLDLLHRFEAGQKIDGALRDYGSLRALPISCTAPAGADWRRERFRGAAAA
jgi:hypothetical protein